ncbi:MAG: bifunctional DNA-formamidopyrimidine glycosylase/DNA-(apurinic or apyrimidinic site) lyase [Mariprofundaceae bacterium]
MNIQGGLVPELPEVEVVRRGLAALLEGKRITRVRCTQPALRYPLPENLQRQLLGRTCQTVRRRAKYLQFFFENDLMLAWHLGMTGQFHVLPESEEAGLYEHVRICFAGGSSLRYRDMRRFGYAGLFSASDWQRHVWFARLGPEPLDAAFNKEYLYRCCAGRRAPIKTLIMQAQVVVGIGNIYASEALFRAGIHPARAANRISTVRCGLLASAIKQVLDEAIAAGGSSISDFVRTDGRPGYFAHRFQVYGRAEKSCLRCGEKTIRRIVQAGRSTFYCTGCQH